MLSIKECVAVLTVLYNNNGAVSCVESDFLSDWGHFTFPRPGMHRIGYGQISIETVTKSSLYSDSYTQNTGHW